METSPIEPAKRIVRLKKQFRTHWVLYTLLIILSFAIYKISWITDIIVILSSLALIIILAKIMRSYQLLKAAKTAKRNKLFIVFYSAISAVSIFTISVMYSSHSRLYHDLQTDPRVLLIIAVLFAFMLVLFLMKGLARKALYSISIILVCLPLLLIININLEDSYYVAPIFGLDRNFLSSIKCVEGEIWTGVLEKNYISRDNYVTEGKTTISHWTCMSPVEFCAVRYDDCPADLCRLIKTPGMLIGYDYIGGSPPECVPKQ